MTLTYCDFCGEQIPINSGDSVQFGNPVAVPDLEFDCCSACYQVLTDFVRHKNLRPKKAPTLPARPDPPEKRES